jgi:hypothetical protein
MHIQDTFVSKDRLRAGASGLERYRRAQRLDVTKIFRISIRDLSVISA